MKAPIIQLVSNAKVKTIGEIKQGILVFLGFEKNDEKPQVDKMNLSVKEVLGGILVVSQFTLAVDTNSGTRIGFSTAKPPEQTKVLFDYFLT